jgi:hypothetical protein
MRECDLAAGGVPGARDRLRARPIESMKEVTMLGLDRVDLDVPGRR